MDCTFETACGRFNFRVGLIILNGRKVLMARNPNEKRLCYYSVGGRVMLGESMEDAARREAKEETDVDCEPGRMVCIHENFFTNEEGVPYHEISCYFLAKPNPALLSIPDGHPTTHGPNGEYLTWIDLDTCGDTPIYPEFLKTADLTRTTEIMHLITRE